ncbi:cytochrome c-type biogenesis protein [Pseudaminobacter soli (ex Li et al. 2025)]|uniref:Cytochrome c-type biogenesis protein n=1 Tax=Pseudaminobacter soli (ex Li et al. 2025) TaxID=1295366 RepID=A0A2P7SFQ7_9HYPH|nr:cytochrome c-type biogenesis protein [Mesorhizobium soli]PSJ61326.1 cytochrome c-type biogenesis protein CcmH [Mesorhizobium soli]
MRRFPCIAVAALLCALSFGGAAYAVQPDEMLKDPALETRARLLSEELRCMVCQNQSIDQSDADLARDLRVLVRERLKAGDTNDQVLDYIVSRYGEFVLLKPRFSLRNAFLWGAPLALLLCGGVAILYAVRFRRNAEVAGLSDQEKEALEKILREDP